MTLRVGIAGLASYYSHYYANRATERAGTEIVAAARLDAPDDGLEALGRLTPDEFSETYGCPVYDSLDELLADDDVDAIAINSLLTRRADDAVAALEAGYPILTGKPAAASAAGGRQIAEAARDADLVAATTSPHRHDGRIREARRRVDAGEVGDVLQVRTSVYHTMANPGGLEHKDGLAPNEPGPAYTMGYYTSDMLQWFADDAEPVRLTGELENGNTPFMEHPDLGSASIRFDDGMIGTMTFSMCNEHGPGYGWELEVHGSEGTIRTDHHGFEGTHWYADDGKVVEAFGRSLDPVLDYQFDAFIDAVATDDGPNAVSPGPMEAARGIGLCDAWVESSEDGRPIDLE